MVARAKLLQMPLLTTTAFNAMIAAELVKKVSRGQAGYARSERSTSSAFLPLTLSPRFRSSFFRPFTVIDTQSGDCPPSYSNSRLTRGGIGVGEFDTSVGGGGSVSVGAGAGGVAMGAGDGATTGTDCGVET